MLSRVTPDNPAKMRKWLDRPLELMLRPARGAVVSDDHMSDSHVPVLRIENGDSSNGTLLYLHGGAYIFGTAKTHRRIVAHICALSGLKGISVNYRLAPEDPFPAAVDDAFAVYKAMLAEGTKNIIIAGDSAGGGLTFALLAKILSEGLRQPDGIVAFSPWTDLSLSGESMKTNDKTEYMLPPHQIKVARDFYAPVDFNNPLASPVLANFETAPPVLIFVGDTEVLRDDAISIAKNMRVSGVDVTLNIYHRTPHVWQIAHGWLPEANKAMVEVQEFIKKTLGAKAQA